MVMRIAGIEFGAGVDGWEIVMSGLWSEKYEV